MSDLQTADAVTWIKRLKKVTNPVFYHGADSLLALSGHRMSYRKGAGILYINVPQGEGVSIKKTEIRGLGTSGNIHKLVLEPQDTYEGQRIELKNGVLTVVGKRTAAPTIVQGEPRPSISFDSGEGFTRAIMQAVVMHLFNDKLSLYDDKENGPIMVIDGASKNSFFGIVVLSSLTRGIMREGFYTGFSLYPTHLHQPIDGSSEVGEETGIGISMLGERGVPHLIVQPGHVLSS